MKKTLIKREDLTLGARIVAMAPPSIGEVLEVTAVHPVGYNQNSGGYRHFIEYDFKEVGSGRTRTSFTLNYINRYFAHDNS